MIQKKPPPLWYLRNCSNRIFVVMWMMLLVSTVVVMGFSTTTATRKIMPNHHFIISTSMKKTKTTTTLKYQSQQQPSSKYYSLQRLAATSDASASSSSSSGEETKIAKRKQRVVIGYKVSCGLYLSAALYHVLKKGVLEFWSLYYACGGPLLSAGIAYILSNAAKSNRLSSDTYKRLNLALIINAILGGLLLPIIDKEHFTTFHFIVPPLMITINAIKGYAYGVLGMDKATKTDFKALAKDFQQTMIVKPFQSIFGTFQKESLDYILAMSMILIMTCVKFKEVVSLILSSSSSSLMIASRMARLARLSLFSTVLFTLKDAADRNRLSGTTFRQLNYLSSVVFFTMAGYLCPGYKPTWLGGASLLFSFITAYNGFTKKKKE